MKVKRFEFNMFGENTYVVFDESSRQAAIIDPGMMNESENSRLAGFIADNRLSVRHIIATHIHIDHILGISFAETAYGVGLTASEADLMLADRIAAQAQMFHLKVSVPERIAIDHPIADGDSITIGDDALSVIAVPGHSLGSVALYSRKSGFLFSGDALFQGSIGRTDLPGGNYAQLIASLQNRLMTLPDSTVVYPGHGPATTIGDEKKFNPYL